MTRFSIVLMFSVVSIPLLVTPAQGQEVAYKWSVGGAAGVAGYFGEYHRRGVFSHPGYALSVAANYLHDARWEFGIEAGVSQVGGKIAGSASVPLNFPEKFTATVGELDGKVEFNFFPYGVGETYKKLWRWSPYVGTGLGVVLAKPWASSLTVSPEIPLYLGVKIKISNRVNGRIGLKFAKTFTHGIDGIEDAFGVKRQWFKGTDWVMNVQAGITWELGERCPTCHYRE